MAKNIVFIKFLIKYAVIDFSFPLFLNFVTVINDESHAILLLKPPSPTPPKRGNICDTDLGY